MDLKSEVEPLMPPERPHMYHTMSVGLRIFLPWIFFLTVSCSFVFVYQSSPAFVWVFMALCSMTALLLMVLPQRQRAMPGAVSNPNWYLLLGILCLFATFLAALLGFWNFQRSMSFYWAYEGMRSYTNVLPTESALAHLDAGKITFSTSARLDVHSAIGYRDGGNLYCVVPVVEQDHLGEAHNDQGRIEYWAAGVNCCDRSGSFSCDSAGRENVHAGLVHVNPGMFSSDDTEQYRQAVQEAITDTEMTSSPDALFVRWVDDSELAQDDYWNSAAGFLCGTCALHLMASTVIGFMLHFGSRPPRIQKKPLRY